MPTKKNWATTVVSQGKWYLFSSLLSKGVMVVAHRFFTEYLSEIEYGQFATITAITGIMPMLISLSIDSAMVRLYHDHSHSTREKQVLFSSYFWFVVLFGGSATTLFLISCIWWFSGALSLAVFPFAIIAFTPPLLLQLSALGMYYLKQEIRAKLVGGIEFVVHFVGIITAVSFMYFWDLGLLGRMLGPLVAALLQFTIILYIFITTNILSLSLNWATVGIGLAYSVPLLPAVLSRWINTLSDRLIIKNYHGVVETGLYALADNIAMIISAILMASISVLQPIVLSGLKEDRRYAEQKINHYGFLLLVFMIWLNMGAFLFAKEALFIFAAKKFNEAFIYVPILSFVLVVISQQKLQLFFLQYHKKTSRITFSIILAAVSNLILNLIFIPYLGTMAAAFTTLASHIIILLAYKYSSRGLGQLKILTMANIKIMVFYAVGLWIGWDLAIYQHVSWVSFGYKIGLFTIFSIAVLSVGNTRKELMVYIRKNWLGEKA